MSIRLIAAKLYYGMNRDKEISKDILLSVEWNSIRLGGLTHQNCPNINFLGLGK